jgi:hypothetical protein
MGKTSNLKASGMRMHYSLAKQDKLTEVMI